MSSPVVTPYLVGVVTAPLVARVIKPMIRGITKAAVGVALEMRRAAAEAAEEFQDIAAEVAATKAVEEGAAKTAKSYRPGAVSGY
jgi:Protein of unknown function (DUF5132)